MRLLAALLIAASPLPRVVVDAGHGGGQDGAIGVCGAKEKDVTLAIASEVERLLDASDKVDAQLTRTGDTTLDLKQRARISNDAKADLFVSIHANSGAQERSHGVEVYFLSRTASDRRVAKLAARENDTPPGLTVAADETTRLLESLSLGASHIESARLADRLHTTLTRELAAHGRSVMQAPFFVLLAAQMPSALIEVGFLTNRAECQQLADKPHQEKLARIIAGAVLLHVAREELAVAR